MATLARLVAVVCLVCGAVVPAAADIMEAPSFQGYTGLVLTPTADVLGMMHWNAAGFTTEISDGENVLAAAVGLPGGLEAGAIRIDPEGGPSETLLHAKYRFPPLLVGGMSIAAGVFDVTDEIDSTAYAVLSKRVAPATIIPTQRLLDPRVHVGVGGGGRLDGLFAGASAVIANRIALMAEYDSDDVNLGARLAITPMIQAHAGWLGDDSDLAVGVSFSMTY